MEISCAVWRDECGIPSNSGVAPNNSSTNAAIVQEVRTALVQYEPRIDVLDVEVDMATGRSNLLLIRIDYRIRANNSMNNLVYPFYINETA